MCDKNLLEVVWNGCPTSKDKRAFQAQAHKHRGLLAASAVLACRRRRGKEAKYDGRLKEAAGFASLSFKVIRNDPSQTFFLELKCRLSSLCRCSRLGILQLSN